MKGKGPYRGHRLKGELSQNLTTKAEALERLAAAEQQRDLSWDRMHAESRWVQLRRLLGARRVWSLALPIAPQGAPVPELSALWGPQVFT